jgi:hypothetical protein
MISQLEVPDEIVICCIYYVNFAVVVDEVAGDNRFALLE